MGADIIMDLLDFFRISNTLSFKEGEILLMDQTVNVTPTSILCDFQKGLIENVGFRKAYEIIYETAKRVSYNYNSEFIKKRGFKSARDILEWQVKIVTLGGWGKWTIKLFEPEKEHIILQIDNSPFPSVYGNSKFGVDIFAAGLVAGGLSASFGKDIETLETKCAAKGDPYCEIEVDRKNSIQQKRNALWAKWKLI